MWDLPRPGLEPVSPALAGRFSTTAPPGKPPTFFTTEIQKRKGINDYLEYTIEKLLQNPIFSDPAEQTKLAILSKTAMISKGNPNVCQNYLS